MANATVVVECPCGEEFEIDLNPELIMKGDGKLQYIVINPDYTDIWAHHWEQHDRPK